MELFCVECESWQVTRSDLVSQHTSNHKWTSNIRREWVTLNISVIITREVWYNQKQVRFSPELYSWYCELFFCVNCGKSNSQTVNFYLSFLYCADIFIHALHNVRHITSHISDKNCKTAKIFKKQKMRPSPHLLSIRCGPFGLNIDHKVWSF